MKRTRGYYDVVKDGGNTILHETNTLARAKKFRKNYLKAHSELDCFEVGINKLYREDGRWYAHEIC